MEEKEIEKQKVIGYLTERLAPLTIKKKNAEPSGVLKLSGDENLIGYCWESTQTCSLFFNDDDYIERGIVTLGEDPFYHHSWICFKLDGREYVFDPALNQIARKELFYKRFKPQVQAKVAAKSVKDYFLKFVADPKVRENKTSYQRSMYEELDNKLIKQLEKSNTIWGSGEVADPFFAGVVSYKPTIQNGAVKKLEADFHSFIIS